MVEAVIEKLRDVVGPVKPRGIQRLRFFSQLFSLLINLWIGLQFYLFVMYIESGGKIWDIPRPAGVEGWLPIGGFVSLLHWIYTGVVNTIHPAGLIIFSVILFVSFLFKKGFCSWICPVGFISEMLGDISDKWFKRRIKPPAWLDWPLRSLKYIILGFFVWAMAFQMTPAEIAAFLHTDYNKVSDILMLRFFTDITTFSLIVITLLFALSLVVRGFWCRYLCPYGALLGLLGLVSPTRIRRRAATCTGCSSCTKVCPAFINVEKVSEVVSDECIGCMACVDSCPEANTLEVRVVSRRWRMPNAAWAALFLVAFWGTLLTFKTVGPWENSISNDEYMRHMSGITRGQYYHP